MAFDIKGILFSLVKPSAPSGSVNLPFQIDETGPNASVSVSAPIATSGAVGLVKPDGATTSVNSSGSLSTVLPSGPANEVVATPDGSTGTASLRALVANDIPALPESKITNLTSDLAAKIAVGATAGGDLGGTLPNPTVAKVNGAAVPTSSAYVGTNSSGQIIAAATPVQSLTTTGTSGAATLSGGVLNIPQYSASSGSGGSTGVDILDPGKSTGTLGGQIVGTSGSTIVAAGASITLLSYSGSDGYVDDLIFRLSGNTGDIPSLNLQVFYNGSTTASIDMPVVYFFGAQYAPTNSVVWDSVFMGINTNNSGGGQYRCSLPLPFSNAITIKIKNNAANSFTLWSSTARLHTGVSNTWTNTRQLLATTLFVSAPTAYSTQTLISATGLNPGRIAGIWMMTDDFPGGVSPRYAPLYGSVKIYLDGAASPNFTSADTWQFFGFSNINLPGQGQYGTTHGTTFFSGTNTASFYRFFWFDPITFSNALRITWDAGNSSVQTYTGTTRLWMTVWYYTQ